MSEQMTDEQLAEYEEKMAGDQFSNNAPRKAKQFWPSAKRLLGLLAPHKAALAAVLVMNAASVVLAVYAPRVMGRAMDVIFSGVVSKQLPPGTTREQAVDGLRAAGQDRFADMAAAMDLRPGSGIDFDHLRELIVTVLDNRGFGCINRLQRACGGESFNNLIENVDHRADDGWIDFAGHARSLGAVSEKVAGIAELEQALQRARRSDRTYVVVIDTDPNPTTEAGGAWWDVAVPEVSDRPQVRAARADYDKARELQRLAD